MTISYVEPDETINEAIALTVNEIYLVQVQKWKKEPIKTFTLVKRFRHLYCQKINKNYWHLKRTGFSLGPLNCFLLIKSIASKTALFWGTNLFSLRAFFFTTNTYNPYRVAKTVFIVFLIKKYYTLVVYRLNNSSLCIKGNK